MSEENEIIMDLKEQLKKEKELRKQLETKIFESKKNYIESLIRLKTTFSACLEKSNDRISKHSLEIVVNAYESCLSLAMILLP